MSPDKTGKQQGRFKKGVSGNPTGRPAGVRNKTTYAIEELLDGEAEAITRKAIEAALGGDMTAIRILMDRLAPPRRDRPITLDLPSIESAADADTLCRDLLRATLSGQITPEESVRLANVIEVWRKASETAQVEHRMQALEQRFAALDGRDGLQQPTYGMPRGPGG